MTIVLSSYCNDYQKAGGLDECCHLEVSISTGEPQEGSSFYANHTKVKTCKTAQQASESAAAQPAENCRRILHPDLGTLWIVILLPYCLLYVETNNMISKYGG